MAFELCFSDKEITAWDGMALMKRMLDYLEFDTALSQAGLVVNPYANRPKAQNNVFPTQRRAEATISYHHDR